MKHRTAVFFSVLVVFGCTTVHSPVQPRARGCSYYCYPDPSLMSMFVSLTRTNRDGTSDTWAGGVLGVKNGDHVELSYTTAICSNMPRAAITFCQFCKTNTTCFPKNIPANGYTMSWDLTNDCETCTFAANNSVAAACPGPPPQAPIALLWDVVDGKTVAVRRK